MTAPSRVALRLCGVLGVVVALTVPAATQQSRDPGAARPIAGTAMVAGTVTSSGADRTGLRAAIVTINSVDKSFGDTTVTDGDGRFTFHGVPGGRYLIAARKPGYLTGNHGATRPGGSGIPIAVQDGTRTNDVSIPLVKGAVLAGTVRTESGEPAEDAQIELLRLTTRAGDRRATPLHAEGQDATDDRGAFRLFGLPPGDYLVRAVVNPGTMMRLQTGVQAMTSADIQWARSLLQSPASNPGTPPARRLTTFAPTYFPGASSRAAAAIVTLGAGDERLGIDITTRVVSTSRVTGTIAYDGPPTGTPPQMHLADVDSTDSFYGFLHGFGWSIAFDAVPPGRYALTAVLDETRYWAMTEVLVSGRDEVLNVRLQPPLTARGRLTFKGAAKPPASGARIEARPLPAPGTLMISPEPSAVAADGTFELRGLVPGRYHLVARATNAWALQALMAGAEDISMAPLVVRADAPPPALALTMTDQPTEISGRFEDASGRAAPDFHIIVFSADERGWYRGSRAIAQTRPATDGRYSIAALPPGSYLLAAVTDVERDQWYDPAFLRELVPAAVKVTLVAGEKKTQDLRIAR